MTGGASSSSSFVMRSHHCWMVPAALVMLLLTSNADSEECSPEILVRRNTVYTAFVGQELRVNCNVVFCNNTPPKITWKKYEGKLVPVNMSSDIKTEWIFLEDFKGISFLIFQNIHISDSGVYHCDTEVSVSHYINISVNDVVFNGTSENNVTTNSSTPVTDGAENMWTYVYCAAGIVSFVIIVIIISVVSLRGCKGKPSKEAGTENQQYMSIPMTEHPSLRTPPRRSPSVPPGRRSSQRETQSRLSRGSEQGGGPSEVDVGRQRTTAQGGQEGGGSIVYAALNHQPRPAARPRRLVEESSEYAAIRVA